MSSTSPTLADSTTFNGTDSFMSARSSFSSSEILDRSLLSGDGSESARLSNLKKHIEKGKADFERIRERQERSKDAHSPQLKPQPQPQPQTAKQKQKTPEPTTTANTKRVAGGGGAALVKGLEIGTRSKVSGGDIIDDAFGGHTSDDNTPYDSEEDEFDLEASVEKKLLQQQSTTSAVTLSSSRAANQKSKKHKKRSSNRNQNADIFDDDDDDESEDDSDEDLEEMRRLALRDHAESGGLFHRYYAAAFSSCPDPRTVAGNLYQNCSIM